MKKILFAICTFMLLAGTTFTSCKSPAQKEKEDQEKINAAENAMSDAKSTINSVDWTTLKREWAEKIAKNDTRIAELRKKMKTSGITMDDLRAEKVDDLEKKNKEIKNRMDSYEMNASDWETFKINFNHDMDELDKSFDELEQDKK